MDLQSLKIDRGQPATSRPGTSRRRSPWPLRLAGLGALLPEASPTLADLDGVRWPGRLELIDSLCFDVAHNLDGIEALCAALGTVVPEPAVIVFGTVADKPGAEMAARLRAHAPLWHVPPATAGHAVREVDREAGQGMGHERHYRDPDDRVLRRDLEELRRAGIPVLICGSHFLVAPLRAWALGLDPAAIDDPGLSDPLPR